MTGPILTGLSKSLILRGLQCPKALYLSKYPPSFEFPPAPERDARYNFGHEVGLLARQLFPGGAEVPYEGLSVAEQIAATWTLMEEGAEVIYEASFAVAGIFIKVDILVRDDDAWQIHEVKMAASIKEVNLHDLAIQYYVLRGCGLKLSAACLVHVNSQYVRQGPIDVQALFASVDALTIVQARQAEMPPAILELRRILEGGEPEIDIGPHCSDPYPCDFMPYCWQHVPRPSVFDLRGQGAEKWNLYRRGILRFDQIPLRELKEKQRQQVTAILRQQDSIDHRRLQAFLDTLWYPLCHLDFETFQAPIPKFDQVRPYQQVPFQFSVHFQAQRGAEAEHSAFLAAPNVDPRRELVEQLLSAVPGDACILVYNQAFEKSVLREMAALFPDLAEEIKVRLENVRDLMLPFRQRIVYRWQMNGSYSIKEVLPAMVPDLDYRQLEIADGLTAMQAYQEMCAVEDEDALRLLRGSMLEYCHMDTLAMMKILEELEALVSGPRHPGPLRPF